MRPWFSAPAFSGGVDADALGDRDGEVVVDVVEVLDHALAYVAVLDLAELEPERGDDVLLLPARHAVPEQRRLAVVVGEALGCACGSCGPSTCSG